MKIVIIHGQSHKGITYTATHAIINAMQRADMEIREFFLPKDGPDFCYGCNACFVKGEAFCPGAGAVQPIAKAMEWADVIILATPNYVLEMSGAMKNLLDHLAYRWITHRPDGAMFHKVGIVVCSSAGAPAMGITKSVARQLKWMGCPKVYRMPFTSNAMTVADLKPKKRKQMEKKAAKIAKAVQQKVGRTSVSLRGKASFMMMRKMQSSPDAAWNPTDRDWWINHGWTGKARPWKEQ